MAKSVSTDLRGKALCSIRDFNTGVGPGFSRYRKKVVRFGSTGPTQMLSPLIGSRFLTSCGATDENRQGDIYSHTYGDVDH